jgi:hypothetical protein
MGHPCSDPRSPNPLLASDSLPVLALATASSPAPSQNKRTALKDDFVSKKKFARSVIAMLKQSLSVLKEKELKELVEEFREVDGEFRNLGVMVERDALLEGAIGAGRGRDKFDPTRAKNDELLDKAAGIQADNTSKLRSGLQTIEATRDTGKFTAAQLEEDREKLKRIDAGLDDVQVRHGIIGLR